MKTEQMKSQCMQVSGVLKALAHPQRLMIMCYLTEEEKTVSELLEVCELSQSHLSQFLNRMQREGLLKVRKEGQFSYYSIASTEVVKLIRSLNQIFCK